MADLQARIGPKVFPNKTWSRPGYEPPPLVKSSPNHHRSWNNRHSAGYDSDASSNSSHDRGQSSRSRKTSIFSRLGLPKPDDLEDDMEDAETGSVEKSLLERVGIPSAQSEQLAPDIAVGLCPQALASGDEDMNIGSSSGNGIIVGAKGEDKPSVKSESIDERATQHKQSKATPTKEVPSSANGHDHRGKDQSNHALHPEEGQTTANISHTHPLASPLASSEPPDGKPVPKPNASINPDLASNPGPPETRCRSAEVGELSEPLSYGGIRGLIVPLVLQNAEGRSSKTGPGLVPVSQLRPGELDPSIVTNDDVSSFSGTIRDVGKELRTREITHSRSGSASLSAVNDSPPSAPHAMRNANRDHPPSAPPPSNTDPKELHGPSNEAGPPHSIISPTSGRYLPTLRYTPSPQRPEKHHDEPYSSSSNRRRSPSPPSARRASFTRGRPYTSASYNKHPSPDSPLAAPMADPSKYVARRTSPAMSLHYGEPASSRPGSERSFGTGQHDARPSLAKGRQYDDRRRDSYNKTSDRRDDQSPGRERDHRRLGGERLRRSTSPVRRGPYKPYRTGRRRSRSRSYSRSHSGSRSPSPPRPRHRLPSRGLHRLPDPRQKDYSHERRRNFYNRNHHDGYSISRSQSPHGKRAPYADRDVYKTQDALAKRPENASRSQSATQSVEQAQTVLPCHNVPGLWFAKVGLPEMGILECDFEVDDETAIKWNLSTASRHVNEAADSKSNKRLSLEICCISKNLVESALANLQPNATPKDIAEAIYLAEKHWPPQGSLIVHVNCKDKEGETIFPDKLEALSHPIQIANHIHEGHNMVQFIQLSGMSDSMFALFAKERVDDTPEADIMSPPQENKWVGNSSTEIVHINPAIISISSIDG